MPDKNPSSLRQKIRDLAVLYGRSADEVQLVAVSKMQSASKIRSVFESGQKIFGENYVAEALGKMEELSDLNIEWHFVGALQTNKVKKIADKFALIHSVDRLSLIQELAARTKGTQALLLQVNFTGEKTKSGALPAEVPSLINEIGKHSSLKLMGFMFMPPQEMNESLKCELFRKAVGTMSTWWSQCKGAGPMALSMGTTHDYEMAIECGATMVRLGTAVFGERT